MKSAIMRIDHDLEPREFSWRIMSFSQQEESLYELGLLLNEKMFDIVGNICNWKLVAILQSSYVDDCNQILSLDRRSRPDGPFGGFGKPEGSIWETK